MNLSRKRHRRLRAILIFLVVWGILLWNQRIVSYELDRWGDVKNNAEVGDADSALRQWHPREELFDENLPPNDPQGELAINNKDIWDEDKVVAEIDYTAFDTPDRTELTHSKDVDPNYAEVFDDAQVKRLDLVISPENWKSMIDNMTQLYGDPWVWWQANTRPVGVGVREQTEDGGQWLAPEGRPARGAWWPWWERVAWERTAGGLGWWGGWGDTFSDEDPLMVPADLFFEGKQRYTIGTRFKGNSSLKSTWSSGNLKLSFKLDFDEYEDDFPRIDNQRFYWFKKLSLKNNFSDPSMLREKVASDLFADAGLAISRTAFYTLYVDKGEGPEYFGVYTLVEEVDDTVIESTFADDSGNLYKPDGAAATFAVWSFDEDQYVKKSNEDEADFSDVQTLLEVINSENRTTDPEAWRWDLDAIFDADVFLKYLAVNGVMQNWDTYGRMTHNYFMYANPDTGALTWIPRDNNEAFSSGKQWWALSLDFSNIAAWEWPLIEYMYQDDEYRRIYEKYLQEVVDTIFTVDRMKDIYASYAQLVEPFANAEVEWYSFLNSEDSFSQAIQQLNEHAEARVAAVQGYFDQKR